MRSAPSSGSGFLFAALLLLLAATVGIMRAKYGQSTFLQPLLTPSFSAPSTSGPNNIAPRARAFVDSDQALLQAERVHELAANSKVDWAALMARLPQELESELSEQSIAELGAGLARPSLRAQLLPLVEPYTLGEQQLVLEPALATLVKALSKTSSSDTKWVTPIRNRLKNALTLLRQIAPLERGLDAPEVDYQALIAQSQKLSASIEPSIRWTRWLEKLRAQLYKHIQTLANANDLRSAQKLMLMSEQLFEADRAGRALQLALSQYQFAIESSELANFSQALQKQSMDDLNSSLARLSTVMPENEWQQLQQSADQARWYGGYAAGEQFVDGFTSASASAAPSPGDGSVNSQDYKAAPTMIVMPIGSFVMGSPESELGHKASEGPQRELLLNRGFAISRTEITVAQFAYFVEQSGYQTEIERFGGSAIQDPSVARLSNSKLAIWRNDFLGNPGKARDPVIHISFNDAQRYVQWLSEQTNHTYRLPTEAEFEYVLRAGSKSAYWWGEQSPSKVLENLAGDADRSSADKRFEQAFLAYRDGFWGPAPVASFLTNPFGVYDMAGNVSEWVEDCWHDSYARAANDFSAWVNPGCNQRVIRGGAWGASPNATRSAARRAMAANTASPSVGFRVVREL